MPDVWANFADLDAAAQDRLAGVLETRGADAQQQAMRRAFLSDVEFGEDARVLEVGCGTGVLTRLLARRPGVASVVGVDVAASLLDKARALASELDNVTFEEADARSLPFEDESFDVLVFDSTLTHVPGPDRAVAEAFRVLRLLGRLAAFDGDYSTTSVAVGENDPLQVCVNAMMAASVNDRWVARRLRTLVRDAGFEAGAFRSHGFAETTDAAYMLTIVDRGADVLCGDGRVGEDLRDALKAEARRRLGAGRFFGHIAYASCHATKPARSR